MSDYLSNLVARSLKIIGTLQPRHASMSAITGPVSWQASEHTPAQAGVESLAKESAINILPHMPLGAEQPRTPQGNTSEQTPSGPADSEQSRASPILSQLFSPQHDEQQATRQHGNRHKDEHLPGQPGLLQVVPASTATVPGEEAANQRPPSSRYGPEEVRKTGPQPLGDRAVPSAPEQPSPVTGPVVQEVEARQLGSGRPLRPAMEMPDSTSVDTGEPLPAVSAVRTEELPCPHPAVQPLAGPTRTEGTPVLEHNVSRLQPTVVPEILTGVTAQPQVTQHAEPVSAPSTMSDARPEPSPEVHVTIASIEIRAIPPAVPQSKKERPRPPVMSLDEYLSKRAPGGSR